MPSLNADQLYGGGRGRAAADEDIERELQEAMGGLSAEELFADPTPRGSKPAETGPPGRKKGKILRIHGQDVFVDVPGGRSQGVLPMEQFTEGPPKIGDEVEITIEGAEAGLLLLSRKGAVMHADWSTVDRGHGRRGPRHGSEQGRPGRQGQRHSRLHAHQPDRPLSH